MLYEKTGQRENTGVITDFGSMNTLVSPNNIAPNECVDTVNTHQVNLGQWVGRTGSTGAQQSSLDATMFPYESRLIHEYQTVAGTPAAASPGVTTNGDTFFIEFCNANVFSTGATPTGAIMVWSSTYGNVIYAGTYTLDTNITSAGQPGNNDPTIHNYLNYQNVKTALVPETNLIPKALTFHGKVIMPLTANTVLELWVENNVFYLTEVALPDFGDDIVLVDARLGATEENNGTINSSLVLAQYIPATTDAPAVTLAQSSNLGTTGAKIICRADDMGGTTYNDVLKNPTVNPDLPPVIFKEVTVPYTARTSPLTGFQYQSRKDINYRPANQVPDWNKATALQSAYPDSRWGYRFVWDFGNGKYSNASADLWVGDIEWSVLTSAQAAALHSTAAYSTVQNYGEPPSGLVGSTLAGNTSAGSTTLTVHTGDGSLFPAANFFVAVPFSTTTGGYDFYWCTSRTGDVLTLAGAAGTVNNYTAGVAILEFGDSNSVNDPTGSFASAAEAVLKALKAQLYDPTYAHLTDDVWMTTEITRDASTGWLFQNDLGLGGLSGVTDINSNYQAQSIQSATFGMQEMITTANRLLKAAGFVLDGTAIPNGGSWQCYLGTGDTYTLPNIYRVDPSSKDGVQNFSTKVGQIEPLLVLSGQMDWEFACNVVPNVGVGNATNVVLNYLRSGLSSATYNTPHYYSLRRLIPVERMLWDWQLSQTYPSSVVFNAPRIGLTILHNNTTDNVPVGAKNLLIFRTKNSLDPSFSYSQYGQVATVAVEAKGTDVYYFDNVTDDNLNFGDAGATPQDYEGVRFGFSANYIENLGERVFYGNVTSTYSPFAPRGIIQNSADGSNPENTDARLIMVTSTAANAFSHTNAGNYTYKAVYKDVSGVQGDVKTLTPIDKRGSGSDNFIIVGYFMGQGYNPSILEMDIYRADSGAGTTKFLTALKPTSDTNVGGFFEDDASQVLGATYSAPSPKVTTDPSQILYTEPLRPEFIPLVNVQELQQQDGDIITGMALQTSDVIITKKSSIFRLFIDTNIQSPQIERIETVSRNIGCIAPCSLVSWNGMVIFLSAQGLKMFDGTREYDVDAMVHTDILGLTQSADSFKYTAFFAPRYDEYILAINTAGSATTAYAYCFKISEHIARNGQNHPVVSRWKFSNNKLFCTRRNGAVISTIYNNPATTSARQSATVIAEDQAVGYDYAQTAVLATNKVYLSSSITMGYHTAHDDVHIKRARRARVRGHIYADNSGNYVPFSYALNIYNAAGMTTDLTRYYAPVSETDFNVQYVFGDDARGTALQEVMTAPTLNFNLQALELQFHTRQENQ